MLTPESFAALFPAVSRETVARLTVYADLLIHWSKTHDLVAPSTLPDLWHRHIADSAQLLAHAPPDAKTWVDLGSGAGFPGLVIAILLGGQQPGETRTTLIESNLKKVSFLAEVARRCGVKVEIIAERIEIAATRSTVANSDVITARALAPLGKLLGLSKPLFAPSTVGLFLKGRDAEAEVQQALGEWQFAYRLIPSITDADARIVEIRQLAKGNSRDSSSQTGSAKAKRQGQRPGP
jgi:16S rRNA (guanine527-N7)-methyltransferase